MALSTNTGSTDYERTIKDLNTGEEITFLETAEESARDEVVMQVRLAPGTVIPPHAHPIEEAFECLEGRLEFQLDGRSHSLGPGGTITADPNHLHGFRNLCETPAIVRIVGRPGAEAEYGLKVKFLLSRDGYLPGGGGPPKNLLLGAVVLHRGGLYFPPLPRWLFRAIIRTLASVGRWRGRERFLLNRYPEYGRYLEILAGPRSPEANSSETNDGRQDAA